MEHPSALDATKQESGEVQICLTLQNELQNIGKSLSCPLCLSTLRIPTLLPCNHAFCRSCLLSSFDPKHNRTINPTSGKSTFRNQCAICKSSCTKRGMTESEHLATLVKAYKKTLRSFGMIPIVYDERADIAMTQIEDTIDFDYNGGDDDDNDDDDSKIKAAPSLQQCHEHLEVSKGIHEQLKRAVKSMENKDTNTEKQPNSANAEAERLNQVRKLNFLLKDQEKVVKVDERALVRAAVSKQMKQKISRSISSERSKVGILVDDSTESKAEEGETKFIGAVLTKGGDRITFQDEQSSEEQKNKKKVTREELSNCSKDSEEENEESYENTQHRVHRAMTALQKSARVLAEAPESQTFFSAPEQDIESSSARDVEGSDQKHDEIMTTQDIMDDAREKEAADRSGEWLEQEVEIEEQLKAPIAVSRNGSKTEFANQMSSRQMHQTSQFSDRFFSANSEQEESQILFDPSKKKEKEHFSTGAIVHVADRTWPGVNKHGGVARISKVHAHFSAGIKYDVSYVLGGREKMVDSAFVRICVEDDGIFQDVAFFAKRDRPEDSTDGPARKSRRVDERNQVKDWIAKIDAEEDSKIKEDESKLSVKSIQGISITASSKKKSEEIKDTIDNASTTPQQSFEGLPPEDIALPKDVEQIIRFMSFRDILESAVVCYKELLMRDIGKKRTIFITTSGLPEKDQSSVSQMVQELSSKEVNLRILKDFNPFKTRVLVTSILGESGQNTAKLRTMKAMRAALAGIPIVDKSWCDACVDSKELLLESGHIVTSLPTKIPLFMRNMSDIKSIYDKPRDLSTATFGIPSLAICRRSGQEVLLFQNVYVFLAGNVWKHDTTKSKDIQLLVKEGGGSILTSASQSTKMVKEEIPGSEKQVVILCDDSNTDSASGITKALARAVSDLYDRPIDRTPVFIVNSKWLFDSISCAKCLETEEYAPEHPIGISLWRLGKEKGISS